MGSCLGGSNPHLPSKRSVEVAGECAVEVILEKSELDQSAVHYQRALV